MTVTIHPSWHNVLHEEFEKPYWNTLTSYVRKEYATRRCFPEGKNIFRAYDLTPFESVKVVILGQDPYHTPWAAMWLSFSVPDGSKPQPSLRNIFKELDHDLGIKRTKTDLTDWAEQGALLLNAVLTVRQWEANSHQGKWWENFTDATIRTLSEKWEHIVFILWWAYAIAKRALIDPNKHLIIASPHPSPFSADRGFFGSRPFSKANEYLAKVGKRRVEW
jgi:uracil-DNA glycosylase